LLFADGLERGLRQENLEIDAKWACGPCKSMKSHKTAKGILAFP
jgi:hypothetical protein